MLTGKIQRPPKRSFYEIGIPEKWAEVGKNIFRIAPFLFLDTPANRIQVLKVLFAGKLGKMFYYLNDEQVAALGETISWMYVDTMDIKICEAFKIGWQNYYLPEPSLEDCVAVEYAYADFYFEAIAKGDSTKLPYLIASLCRPQRSDYAPESPDYDGVRRERFNPMLIEKRAKLIENKLSVGEKMYFLLYFIGAKKRLKDKFSVLFQEREEEEIISLSPNFGMVGLIWDVAGNLKDEETIQYTNLHNLFSFLVKKQYDAEEMQRNQKRTIPNA